MWQAAQAKVAKESSEIRKSHSIELKQVGGMPQGAGRGRSTRGEGQRDGEPSSECRSQYLNAPQSEATHGMSENAAHGSTAWPV